MGQRLVITTYANCEAVCSCYYHWAAYTTDAMQEVSEFIKAWNNIHAHIRETNKKLAAVQAFINMNPAAGIDHDDIGKLPEFEGFPEGKNRNEGLIAVTPETIHNHHTWAEGTVDVYLDSETVDFDVFWFNEEYCRDELDSDGQAAWDKAWAQEPISPAGVPFAEFDTHMQTILNRMNANDYGYCKVSDDMIAETC